MSNNTKGRKISISEKPVPNVTRADPENRPERSRVGGHRDMFSVKGKDPNYEYRFVKDVMVESGEDSGALVAKPGQRLMQFIDDGWNFVLSSEVVVSDNNVYKTNNLGSIVKIPAGQDEYLYLMKIKKEWFEEDKMELERLRYNVDEMQTEAAHEQGLVGSVSFGK